MGSTISSQLRRILAKPVARERVHFHTSSDGRPFVCDVERCDSAALSLDEVAAQARHRGRAL